MAHMTVLFEVVNVCEVSQLIAPKMLQECHFSFSEEDNSHHHLDLWCESHAEDKQMNNVIFLISCSDLTEMTLFFTSLGKWKEPITGKEKLYHTGYDFGV